MLKKKNENENENKKKVKNKKNNKRGRAAVKALRCKPWPKCVATVPSTSKRCNCATLTAGLALLFLDDCLVLFEKKSFALVSLKSLPSSESCACLFF